MFFSPDWQPRSFQHVGIQFESNNLIYEQRPYNSRPLLCTNWLKKRSENMFSLVRKGLVELFFSLKVPKLKRYRVCLGTRLLMFLLHLDCMGFSPYML